MCRCGPPDGSKCGSAFGWSSGKCKNREPPINDVELLHSQTNRQHRHLPLDHFLDEYAIADFPAFGHRLHGRRRSAGLAGAGRCRDRRSAHAVDTIEKCVDFRFLAERGAGNR